MTKAKTDRMIRPPAQRAQDKLDAAGRALKKLRAKKADHVSAIADLAPLIDQAEKRLAYAQQDPDLPPLPAGVTHTTDKDNS